MNELRVRVRTKRTLGVDPVNRRSAPVRHADAIRGREVKHASGPCAHFASSDLRLPSGGAGSIDDSSAYGVAPLGPDPNANLVRPEATTRVNRRR